MYCIEGGTPTAYCGLKCIMLFLEMAPTIVHLGLVAHLEFVAMRVVRNAMVLGWFK